MTEKILLLRETFDSLPPDVRFTEARRFMRLVSNADPIIISPVDNPNRELTFHRVEEVITYLFNLGYERAAAANVYKVLRGVRKTAYDHRMWYGED